MSTLEEVFMTIAAEDDIKEKKKEKAKVDLHTLPIPCLPLPLTLSPSPFLSLARELTPSRRRSRSA